MIKICNPKLLAIAAIGGAIFTGGASLGLLGAGASTAVLGTTAAATAGTVASAGVAATAATAATTAMTAMQGVSLAASIGGAGLSAASAWQAQDTAKAVASNNAKTADINAQSALAAGERDAQAVQRRASGIEGAQRARMAANGLDITSGTAASLIDQTDFFAAQDVATARNNAKKQAFNFQAQGAGYQAQADGYSPLMAAGSTMLTGAGQVADRWYSYNRPSGAINANGVVI